MATSQPARRCQNQHRNLHLGATKQGGDAIAWSDRMAGNGAGARKGAGLPQGKQAKVLGVLSPGVLKPLVFLKSRVNRNTSNKRELARSRSFVGEFSTLGGYQLSWAGHPLANTLMCCQSSRARDMVSIWEEITT